VTFYTEIEGKAGWKKKKNKLALRVPIKYLVPLGVEQDEKGTWDGILGHNTDFCSDERITYA
jgi:hypothetical protein